MQALNQQWQYEQTVVFSDDANIGDEYREHDELPELDTFVFPGVRGYDKLPPADFDNT